MKGIIFNLLETVVAHQYGDDAWDQLLAAAGTDGAYTSLGSYPDEELGRLVGAASQMLGLTPDEVLRWFGQQAMPLLAARYPEFFSSQTTTRSFVLSTNSIIHPEVLKIYPGADVPFFQFRDTVDRKLLMDYRSHRKLCALAQGFIEGAAAHYGETVVVEHLECMHRGDTRCLSSLSFMTAGK